MNTITKQTFDEERALYGIEDAQITECQFDGPADGESALKECKNIAMKDCYFNLRYPLWHVHGLEMNEIDMTEGCRAALWYSDHITIEKAKMHGIKALRECAEIMIKDSDIQSPEFGWSAKQITMKDSTAVSEYFLLRAEDIQFEHVNFTGKYSFQYIKNAVFDHCVLDTKDAFWHGQNILVKNSVVKGEYLAWYSDGLTLENCKIIGTQPFCYCKNLTLKNCEMIDTDLCFEKSEVEATITTSVMSIKNPKSGKIVVESVGEIIMDDADAKGEIVVKH